MGTLGEESGGPGERVRTLPELAGGLSADILRFLPAAIYACDRDGIIVDCNARAVELWGRGPRLRDVGERFCGSHRLYRLDGGVLAPAQGPMAEVLRTGRPVSDREVIIERPDGSRVIALVNIAALRDEFGEIDGAVGCLHDVTEHRRIEENLRQSERRAREHLEAELADARLLRSVSAELIQGGDIDALYERLIDAAMIIMRSDYASMQMLYPERGSGGELRLLAFRGFDPGAAKFWEWVRADSESTCGAAFRTGKRVIAPDVETCDFMAGSEDLATYLQTGIRAVQTTPLFSRSGRLLGMISTHWRQPHDPPDRDLARLDVLARQAAELIEHAQVEAAIHKSDERYRSLVSIITDVPWTTNAAGAFVEPQIPWMKFTGQSWEEMRGFGWADALHPDDRAGVLKRWETAIASRSPYESSGRIWHAASQEYRHFMARGTPVLNAAGDVREWVGACTDVHERALAEERRALLFREMSHRIKNPFAIAGSIVTLSARSASTTQQMGTVVRDRLGALMRAQELVLGGKIDSGETVDTAATLSALASIIVEPYIDLERFGDRESLTIRGPHVAIGREAATNVALVLHELATNAAKYGALSSGIGSIEFEWLTEGGRLLLSWTERGGPPLEGPPPSEGFGSRLAEASVTGQLAGQITREWNNDGLIVRLTIPLDSLSR